jgi:Ca-activated chloride channel family protein
MNIKLDKETITRYVLGEMDEAERGATWEAINSDPEAQILLQELRDTIQLVEGSLQASTSIALLETQRITIQESADRASSESESPLPRKRSVPSQLMTGLMKAAMILAVPGVILYISLSPQSERASFNPFRAREAARRSSPESEMRVRMMEKKLARQDSIPNLALRAAPMAAEEAQALQSLGYLAGNGGAAVKFEPAAPARNPYDDPNQVYWPGHNTETYDTIKDNEFLAVDQNPLSTFSIDVDTASYANTRRFLNQNTLPPKDAVRIEEMINYFAYDYSPPDGEDPFAANVLVAGCPWTPEHRLVRIGLKGWEMANDERPASNLVFLIDVSGSMGTVNKLPLLKEAMKLLVSQLTENDTVSMVVYAGASGLVLPPTNGDNKQAIIGALDRLQSGGSTNGGAGIQLAYDTAVANYIEGGVNRVILASDGDFNVGTTNRGDLTRLVEEKAKSGVFLTILGFGMGNIKDATFEELSNKGNGNYAYIDALNEAKKVLVQDMGGTLVTIAKDVKIQVEFNPVEVSAYRLIGYENRILAAEDFNDDTKDAGEIGAGHTVTALYEIVPAGMETDLPQVDPLRYQQTQPLTQAAGSGEVMTLKLRYKQPDGDTSKLLTFPVRDLSFARADEDFKFTTAVAAFGMLLRDSPHKGHTNFDSVLELAEEGRGTDPHGYRQEFIDLVLKARGITPRAN